ncbi:MAG: hypothetical protein M1819_005930 [Sarea resinae]|nr:MAG: hypothetical protein M1819_005930 [Sarea resinae]
MASSTVSAEDPDQFPRRAGLMLTGAEFEQRESYPSQSANSLDGREAEDSSLERTTTRVPDLPDLIDSKGIMRELDRGTGVSDGSPTTVPSDAEKELSKSRHKFYGELFADRQHPSPMREQAHQDSIVTVEMHTNILVTDEFNFMTQFSSYLAQRYRRAESSIMITFHHSSCLILGGVFEKAYVLTITALPSEVQPTTNKRNAALLTDFLSKYFTCSPDRSIIHFQALAEENLARAGTTVLGHIEAAERAKANEAAGSNNTNGAHHHHHHPRLRKSISKVLKKKKSKASSMASPTTATTPTTPMSMSMRPASRGKDKDRDSSGSSPITNPFRPPPIPMGLGDDSRESDDFEFEDRVHMNSDHANGDKKKKKKMGKKKSLMNLLKGKAN